MTALAVILVLLAGGALWATLWARRTTATVVEAKRVEAVTVEKAREAEAQAVKAAEVKRDARKQGDALDDLNAIIKRRRG